MVSEVMRRASSLGYNNLRAKEGDALRTDLGRFDVCIANLPYQISSPFIFKLCACTHPFRVAILMFQYEFAERLLAEVGHPKFGRLALNVRLFCKVTRVCKVAAGSFNPPPKVDSMVVAVTPRKPKIDVDFREWDGLIRICFHRKRRTLRSAFNSTAVTNVLEANYKTWCSINKATPEPIPVRELVLAILEEEDLSSRRAITVDIDTYFKLLLAFNKRGIHFVNVASQTAGDAVPDYSVNDLSFLADEDDDGME
eukprot:GHVT01023553.1.p1 GENE.GHVT01023553.1~~GHVT01023553.1.p1  ORF type:complete len:254 (-),score=44.02 GHVT01023553.1:380-1141(-)